MTSSKILFNDLVSELRARIESYKENGFEYESLEKSLNDIIIRCESDTKMVKNGPFMAEEESRNYSKYYKELTDLLELNQKQFNDFMFFMFAKYIKSIKIDAKNINEFVNNAISYLQKCKDNLSTSVNIDIIFDSLLDLILMELVVNDNSDLLDYIKRYSELCYFLNRVAYKRSASLNENDVKIILNREGATGELFPYIDEDMLKLMIIGKDTPLKEDIVKQVKALEAKLEAKVSEQKNLSYRIEKVENNNENRTDAIKAFALSLALITIPVGLSALLYKPMCKIENYNTIITEYSETQGYETREEVIELVNNGGEETLILEYEPWEHSRNDFVREYREYDVSHIDYEDLAEYLLLDLERLGINYQEKKEHKDALAPNDLYSDTEYVVIDYKQDIDNPVVGYELSDNFRSILWFFGSVFAITILGYGSILTFFEGVSLLKDYFDKNQYLKDELGSNIKKLLDKYNAADRDITKIEDELLALYNKYKFLLENTAFREEYHKLERKRNKNDEL